MMMYKLTLEQRTYLQLLQSLHEQNIYHSGYDYNISTILDEGKYDDTQRNSLNVVGREYKQYLKLK